MTPKNYPLQAWSDLYNAERKLLDAQGVPRTARDLILKTWTLGYVAALRETARDAEGAAADIMCDLNNKGREPE